MQQVIEAIERLYQRAHDNVKATVTDGGRISGKKMNENQLAAHAVAYMATELEACRQMAQWAERVGGEYEAKVARAYVGEVARSLVGRCRPWRVREHSPRRPRHQRRRPPRDHPLARGRRVLGGKRQRAGLPGNRGTCARPRDAEPGLRRRDAHRDPGAVREVRRRRGSSLARRTFTAKTSSFRWTSSIR